MVRLFVRDNLSGDVHEYGDDSHDSLILSEDGSLHYYNLHNGTGTMFPEEGYSFCLADGSDPRLCEDYIEYGVEPYINIGGETMNDDLISRQAAIDIVFRSPFFSDSLMEELRALPAAQPKTGRWFDIGSLSCRCSNCGGKNNRESKFCPNCGAKMDGGEEHG